MTVECSSINRHLFYSPRDGEVGNGRARVEEEYSKMLSSGYDLAIVLINSSHKIHTRLDPPTFHHAWGRALGDSFLLRVYSLLTGTRGGVSFSSVV